MNISPVLIFGAVTLLLLSKKDKGNGSSDLNKYCVRSPFGKRKAPKPGASKFHNGIDLNIPANTRLFAPGDTIILKSFFDTRGGNQVIYRLKNGVTVGYAHLNKRAVKAGDKLKKGQLIGLSGNTGISTGPHLHVTVRRSDGTLIDPTPYFKVGNCNKA